MSTTKQKVLLFIISLLPLFWMTYALFTDQLGANPIEAITRDSGLWALRFLCLTLVVTPFKWYTGLNLVPLRRMLGLYVFFYAVVHMLLYLWLDQFFDLAEIIKDIIKRPFITIGFLSFLALIPLAITSNKAMIKRMGGAKWKKLHRLTYLIAILSSLHFYMLVKQDKTEPLIYAFVFVVLLSPRLFRTLKAKMSQKSSINAL